MDAEAREQLEKVITIYVDVYMFNLLLVLLSREVQIGEKWKCQIFVCQYSDYAHPGIYSCPAMMVN